jgi:hypothetical protein
MTGQPAEPSPAGIQQGTQMCCAVYLGNTCKGSVQLLIQADRLTHSPLKVFDTVGDWIS